MVDTEPSIRWEPLPLSWGLGDWAYGRITTPQEFVHTSSHDNIYDEDAEALVPELFAWDEMIASERVKDLIDGFASKSCYVSPMKLNGRKSGDLHPTPYFKVLIRQAVEYIGDAHMPRRKKEPGARIGDEVWSGLCENAAMVRLVADLPIFIFGRDNMTPVVNAALDRHLKAHSVSGLAEYSEGLLPGRSGLRDFAAVTALRPGPDVPLRQFGDRVHDRNMTIAVKRYTLRANAPQLGT